VAFKSDPKAGLVVRYDYLWNDEKRTGRAEGAKVRPCAVVLARTINDQGRLAVMLAPITHSLPSDPADAIEIPTAVKRHLGLDDQRSWIIVREVNTVAWDDPGIVPVSSARWHYGFLPEKLTSKLVDAIAGHMRARKLRMVDRPMHREQ
jgi:mRNA-degrading endonuclease toxin of MazEF toxin-antitoxin module